MAAAPPAAGVDLAAALTAAVGSIGDAGGTASHLCARPSVLADQRNERDDNGQRLYPQGLGDAFGLTEVGCPELAAADVLVVARDRAWLVVRNDFRSTRAGTGRSRRMRWPSGSAAGSRSPPR